MEGISVRDECPYCGEVHTGPCVRSSTPVDKGGGETASPPKIDRHRRKKGPRPKLIGCETCEKVFTTRAKLAQHRYVHTGEKPFVCATCAKGFSSKFRLVRHLLIHSDSPKYTCQVCTKNFHRKDHLKTHSKTHGPQETLRCECGKEYTALASYRRHLALHSAQGGDLKCRLCSHLASDRQSAVEHVKSHSGSRTSRGEHERKHKCDDCGRMFFMKKEMWRHSVVHTGKRDFLCQFCPQAYGRNDHLLRHIRKRHLTAETSPPKETTTKGPLPNFKDAFQS